MKHCQQAASFVIAFLLRTSAAGQTAPFRTHRPIEFHLAEDQPGPGLIAIHVEGEARIVYVQSEVRLDDRNIRRASVVTDAAGRPAVQVRLTPAGVQKFNAIAEGSQYKTLAIAANNKVIAAPVIDGKLIDDV